jgi:hypothetical protein
VEKLYQRLFAAGTKSEKQEALRRIEAGRSVLDLILQKAKRIERAAGREDRARLDQYFQSVREMEERLQRSIYWENQPKPSVDDPTPKDIADANQVIAKSRLMFDLIRLALQTDSTRVVTLSLSTFSVVPHVPGVRNETHGLTHHGNEEGKIAELRKIEEAQLKVFDQLLTMLAETPQAGGSLLDHTHLIYGSCLGNANSHSTRNLPILLAGGRYRHGHHLEFDENKNTPLANLFVTILQRMGMETDRFASSTGTLSIPAD